MRQKRIMILGGNAVQAEATAVARQMGYYTISTDLHPANPGHAIADEYCPVDVVDKDAVLREARRLHIDGIIPYASDVLAPVAAYVAEQMGLPGNPYAAVDILTHKHRFREFLATHGLTTLRSKGVRTVDEAVAFFHSLGGTAMMKPVDSAGSKGVFHVLIEDDILAHWDETLGHSMEGTVIIEDYIEREGLQQDGDILVVDGRIVFWGVGDQHKVPIAPYVPAIHTFPSTMPAAVQRQARQRVQDILTALGFRQGPCNVEYMLDTRGEVHIMEIGPRNGGNLIPLALHECAGIPITDLTIRLAVGDPVPSGPWPFTSFAACLVLHSQQDGTFRGIEISEASHNDFRRQFIFKKKGDAIHRFHNGGDTVGTMVFAFNNREELEFFYNNLHQNIKVLVS